MPPPKPTREMENVHARIPAEDAQWLTEQAALRMVSVSRLISEAVARLRDQLPAEPIPAAS